MRPSPSVHPRVRGEHAADGRVTFALTGSSPRSRGTPTVDIDKMERLRFIPAFAGNTAGSHSHAAQLTVHPRVRGEHTTAGWPNEICAGSSLRSRGTPRLAGATTCSLRFIPAFAGNTPCPVDSCSCRSVHPRVRGEHVAGVVADRRHRGSSPRSRGTLPPGVRIGPGWRFIPAFAGNTRHR